jgi:hypothetical protein
MGDKEKGSSVTRVTGQAGKPTPLGTASIGVSIHFTPLTVLVQTPNGGAINNVEIEVWGLRKFSTGANSNKITFNILDSEYDQIVATHNNQVNIKARSPHYGPEPASPSTPVTPGEVEQNSDFTKGTPSTVIMVLQDAAIGRYTDTYDSIACRALTLRQARDALLCLHSQGNIRLIPEPTFNHTGSVCNAANCKVAHPLVGERVGMNSKVGDVNYLYIGVIPQDNNGVAGNASAGDLLQLDVRNGVGLWRLAQLLQNNYRASSIYHSGISGGGVSRDGSPRIDCHGQGRAIDFDGAAGNTGTVTVQNDWGSMQVWDLSDPETDLTLKRRLPKGQNWPPGDRTLMYRLDPLPPGGRDLARRVFQDVYNFAVAQYNDKTGTATQTDPPSVIGGGGRVMNADHHDSDPGGPSGREAHTGHMHMQIGQTGTEPAPAIEPEP